MQDVLAIDIGATKIIIALFKNNKIIIEKRYPTPKTRIEQAIRKSIRETLKEAGIEKVKLAGIAAPGPLDLSRGLIKNSPNIPQETINLVKPLKGLVETAIIGNDAVSAAWAEAVLGKAPRDFILVTIGTGIGGGIIINGEPVLGRRGWAHEIGHIVVDPEGPSCGCGGKGHWEAIAGGAWLNRTIGMILDQRCKETSLDINHINLFTKGREGDPCALKIIDYISKIHSIGISTLTSIFDPEAIYLTGGLYWAGRVLLKPRIIYYMEKYVMKDRMPELRDATFGPLQSLYGAYAIAISPPKRLLELNKHELAPEVRDPRSKGSHG